MSYLSRLTLKRTPSVAALQALLDPADEGRRIDAHHRLIWSAFAGDQTVRRDFLWREDGDGRFLVLSCQPPQPSELFEEPETKPFAPDLRPGDRLSFLLRVNATRTVKSDRITASGKRERCHIDVVMARLKPLAKMERADMRMTLAQDAARAWLDGVGERNGFRPVEAAARGYRVLEPPSRGARRPRFGVLDLEGRISVVEPDRFLARLTSGFGRAKAFGCGLMLIRRA
jgi:CRISPR system Cascade subunit CasE